MRLIDSHAHIGEDWFDEDRAAMLRRARCAGVETVGVIGYNVESSRKVIEVVEDAPTAPTEDSPALFATAGFAPHNVAEADAESRTRVRELLDHPRVLAVGEIGLDYHYDMPRDEQRDLYAAQLGWAVESNLPVVIHSREAETDVVEGIRRAGAVDREDSPLRGVIHCFTETTAMAEAVLELGFYVSFSGILTFKNAAAIRATAALVPLERTLIETDSPYLAPAPHRGKRNEPAFVAAVAECLAEIHGVSTEQVVEATAGNCRRLFRLD